MRQQQLVQRHNGARSHSPSPQEERIIDHRDADGDEESEIHRDVNDDVSPVDADPQPAHNDGLERHHRDQTLRRRRCRRHRRRRENQAVAAMMNRVNEQRDPPRICLSCFQVLENGSDIAPATDRNTIASNVATLDDDSTCFVCGRRFLGDEEVGREQFHEEDSDDANREEDADAFAWNTLCLCLTFFQSMMYVFLSVVVICAVIHLGVTWNFSPEPDNSIVVYLYFALLFLCTLACLPKPRRLPRRTAKRDCIDCLYAMNYTSWYSFRLFGVLYLVMIGLLDTYFILAHWGFYLYCNENEFENWHSNKICLINSMTRHFAS